MLPPTNAFEHAWPMPFSPDHVGRDPAAGLLRLRQLLVRRRGGVDDQRLGVAHLLAV